jgi:ABC-type transport system involved in Fe-S cluster assembly fused permease/ATPase subunit
VLIDGRDVRDVTPESLRRHIGIVYPATLRSTAPAYTMVSRAEQVGVLPRTDRDDLRLGSP